MRFAFLSKQGLDEFWANDVVYYIFVKLLDKTLRPSIGLAASIGPLHWSPLRNELEVAKRIGDEGQPTVELRVNINRAIDEETEKIDDRLLQLMERLRTHNQFDVIKAVQFAYQGD
jgi:hypothetical protein